MEQELQGALVGFIEMITSAAEFSATQMPEVVEQLLMFSLIKAYAIASLGVFVLVLFMHSIVKYGDDEWLPPKILAAAASSIFLFIAIVEILKITIAPKVWLIEYAADLIR